MKRSFAVFVLILAILPCLPAQESGSWTLHAEFDLFLGIKIGAEYRITDSFGIRGTFGCCVISPIQFSYTLVGVQHFMPSDSAFQLDLEFGLIQNVFDILEPVLDLNPDTDNVFSYWVPGAAVAVGFRPAAGHTLSLRGGAGMLFGYDLGAWKGPSFHPNLAVQYDLGL